MSNDEFRNHCGNGNNGNGNNGNGCDNGSGGSGCRPEVMNKAFIDFEKCGRMHTFESESGIKIVKIEITQEPSCDYCVQGDYIELKIKIKNDSDAVIHACDFRDIIPKGTEYVRNSFKVNGRKAEPEVRNRTICYHLDEIKACEEIIITFEIEVR